MHQSVRATEQKRKIVVVPGHDDTTHGMFLDHPAEYSPVYTNDIFDFARKRLEGYVVTNTPPFSVFSSSLADAGSEGEIDSAVGFEGFQIRFDGREVANSPPPSSFELMASREKSSLEKSSCLSEAKAHLKAELSGESATEHDSVRASHFAEALARMEGRIPPSSSSPIERYVHPERHYNENVELEHFTPVLRCPRPMRRGNNAMIGRLFQFEMVNGSDKLELHDFAMLDESHQRPANPTPDSAIFHNESMTPDLEMV